MSILSKAIYKFNGIPINIPMAFFTEVEKKTLKIYMEPQKTPNNQEILKKKKKAGSITFPDFKLYNKATVIKTMWYWYHKKDTPMEQNQEPKNKPTQTWSTNI